MGEDDVLMREGIARLLEDAGFEIVARAGDAEDFARKVRAHRPDLALVDVQMPPGGTDDGLRAAIALRKELPGLGRGGAASQQRGVLRERPARR